MKAVLVRQFGPCDQVGIEEIDEPVPAAGEVVVAVEAAEVNYPDILMIEGRYQVKPQLPFVPGKGIAGRVVAMGSGVSGLEIGQMVAAQLEHGAFAERVSVPRTWCYPVPDGIDAATAAAGVLTYQTAWFALTDRAAMTGGESVLVLGAGGGVGIAAIQLAKALGADTVIAGTRGTAKADLVRHAGADHVIDLSMPHLRDGLRDRVRELTGGKGVDIVIDPVGGAVFEPALRALAWRGRLVVVGFTGGEIPVARANYLLVRNISVVGLQGSDYRDRWPEACAEAQARIFELIASGAMQPEVGERYPLAQFTEALRVVAAGDARGKLVLLMDEAAS